MAARVFDTYSPGSEDILVSFLNSLSDGRILCLAIQVSPMVLIVILYYYVGSEKQTTSRRN